MDECALAVVVVVVMVGIEIEWRKGEVALGSI